MATYIQGLTDYVPQLQPFQPDYNFLGNILQTRQGKYDAAHKKINGIYGTVLNSPLLRDSNIKKRDEFFKAIDGDIKRISGLDLSKEQNVQQAQEVFRPFFEDKNIINDMTNTKKFYNGMEKHEFLKNCLDPDKCGGQAWEEGKRDLQYQAEEFKKMSDKDALNFQMGSYVPKYNWEKDAIKLADTVGLSVSQDSINGNWIVHRENGELVQGGLFGLFKSVYGNDQRVIDNYDVKARVGAKDYAMSNAQQHGSQEAAEAYYLNDKITQFNKVYPGVHEEVTDAVASTSARTTQLANKKKTDGLTSKEEDLLNRMTGITDSLKATQDSVEKSIYRVDNDIETPDLATLRRKGLYADAQMMMHQDIGKMAVTMSQKGQKLEYKVNPYGMEAYQQKNREKMAWQNFNYDKAKMSIKLRSDMTLEDFKHGLKSGIIPNQEGSLVTPLDSEGLAVVHSTEAGAGVRENAQTIAKDQSEYKAMAAPFLYDTFNKAVGYANINNKGAEKYLKNTFGKDWRDIKTQADMENAIKKTGRTLETAFDYTNTSLSPDKNPTDDIQWAQSHLNDSKAKIDAIDTKHEALYANINANLETSKKIVNNMQAVGKAPGNEVYRDADLLLTKAGMPIIEEDMPVEFARNYFNKHHTDPGFDPTDYFDDAKDTYEVLRDKFQENFQATPGSSLNQGAGLAGGGTTSYPGLKFSNVHSKAGVADRGNTYSTSILKAVVPNTNSYNVVIGAPTADAIASQKNIEPLKGVLTPFLNAALSRGKNDPDIVYNSEIRPVVGNNKDLSAITVYPPEEIIKDFRGTDKKPGVLAGYAGQGITMYWNNKELGTPITNMTAESDLEVIARHGGKKYDAFPNAVQDATLGYDETTGKYRFNGAFKGYDEKGQPTLTPFSEVVVRGNVDKSHAALVQMLAQREKVNLQIEAQIALANKNKQKTQ